MVEDWFYSDFLVYSITVEVPLSRRLTLTAPDEPAVTAHGRLRCRCVNMCMNSRWIKRQLSALNVNVDTDDGRFVDNHQGFCIRYKLSQYEYHDI